MGHWALTPKHLSETLVGSLFDEASVLESSSCMVLACGASVEHNYGTVEVRLECGY